MANLKIFGRFCPYCGMAHGREGEEIDPDAGNRECRNCGGELPVE